MKLLSQFMVKVGTRELKSDKSELLFICHELGTTNKMYILM